MATATIIVKDTEDGELDVHVAFSDPGMDHNSRAHLLALNVVRNVDVVEESENG